MHTTKTMVPQYRKKVDCIVGVSRQVYGIMRQTTASSAGGGGVRTSPSAKSWEEKPAQGPEACRARGFVELKLLMRVGILLGSLMPSWLGPLLKKNRPLALDKFIPALDSLYKRSRNGRRNRSFRRRLCASPISRELLRHDPLPGIRQRCPF